MYWIPHRTRYTLKTIDLFCGFGGWSTAAGTCGIDVANALNHWDDAVMVHSLNHPHTAHYLVDIRKTNPRQYASTDIFLGSPCCTDFSQAKGVRRDLEREGQLSFLEETDPEEFERKVAEAQRRATMWDVIRFVEYHDYAAGVIENVVQVHKWSQFPKWCRELQLLGYNYKLVYFNSMFFHELNGITGLPYAPQSRDRWYCVFWKKELPAPNLDFRPWAPCPNCGNVQARQIWKNQQWGKYGIDHGQYYYGCPTCTTRKWNKVVPTPVEPYYFAAINAINFDIPIKTVGDPTRKNPISEKTKVRIKAGLEKYGWHPQIHNNQDFGGENYPFRSALLNPLFTKTTTDGQIKIALPFGPHPVIHSNQTDETTGMMRFRSAFGPLYTQCASNDMKISIPPLLLDGYSKDAVSMTDHPLHTQTTQQSAAMAFITDTARGGNTYPPGSPLPTQTTAETQGIVVHPQLVELYGGGETRDVREPLNTVTTCVKTGLMITTYNGDHPVITTGLDALSTVTTVERHGMSVWDGKLPDVEDVYYRTLRAKWKDDQGTVHSEIRNAMGFPEEYEILGNRKRPLPGREITRGFGGAINPCTGKYLIQAVLEGPLR
jgi:DNA (cytosine-5)-methyltransferase 1